MSDWCAKLENFKNEKYFRLFQGVSVLSLNGWILFWKEDTNLWNAVIRLYFRKNTFHRMIDKRDAFTLIKLRQCKVLRKRWGFFRKLLTMTKRKGRKILEQEVEKHYILERLR